MPTTLAMQGAIKLREVMELYLPRAMESRKLLKIFPLNPVDELDLIYERRQVRTGVQHARGLGGASGPVRKQGVDQYRVPVGYYGDQYPINEEELIRLREIADWSRFESYDKHLARATDYLTQRFLDRCELSIGSLVTTGKFVSSTANGVAFHQDAFKIEERTPSTLFSDLANATPIKYIRDLIPTLELGRSISFRKGFMLCSRPTANLVLNNTNPNDVGGRRLENGANVWSLEDANKILLANDLPQFRIYDGGYYPDGSSTFTRFIPNGEIVLVGVRDDGDQIGEYRLTRAAQNEGNKPGEWYQVRDLRDHTPPAVILEAGHNGGPVPYYPEGICVIHAAAPF